MLVLVLVVVVLVVVLVVVDVLVLVEVDKKITPSQLLPLYRNHAFCTLSQYSSPATGPVGAPAETLSLPLKSLICVPKLGIV